MSTPDSQGSPDFLGWAYQSQSPLRTLWRWADCRLPRLLWMMLMFTIKQSPRWMMPILMALLIDKLTRPDAISNRRVALYIGLQCLLLAGNIPFHTYYIAQLSRITRQLERRLRQALSIRLQHLSIPYHDENESGRLQAKVLRDVEQVHMVTHQIGEMGMMIFIVSIWIFGYTLYRKPVILLVYLGMIPIVLLIRRAFKQRIRKENRAFRQTLEQMNSEVTQMIEMIPVSRAHGVEDTASSRVDRHFIEVKDRGRRLDQVNALFQSSSWVTFQVANVVMILISAGLCLRGHISVGEVVLFEQLFNQLMVNVNMMMGIYPLLARGMESVRSIGEVLECPDLEQNQGKQEVDDVRGHIEYRNVGFTYRNNERPALADVDLTVTPGECVAIVGPSGGGKSTLMRLTIGFLRPTSGHILLDGHDLEEIDMRSWRRFISVVPQESVLFEGTVRENILFGLDEVDETRFQEILDAANVREFVDTLPQGLDTFIGESGARLSGGQRQRLAIARALVRDPRVIVLDEPTSALDVVSEKLVQSAIDELVKNRTTLIVAHRLSTIRNADRVVVLENGRVTETGAYDDLAARTDGAFRRLRDLQL